MANYCPPTSSSSSLKIYSEEYQVNYFSHQPKLVCHLVGSQNSFTFPRNLQAPTQKFDEISRINKHFYCVLTVAVKSKGQPFPVNLNIKMWEDNPNVDLAERNKLRRWIKPKNTNNKKILLMILHKIVIKQSYWLISTGW